MSIKAEIRSRIHEGRLAVFTQAIRRLPDRRELYVAPEIKNAIDAMVDPRFGRARALLETFVRGEEIVARWPPDKNVTAMMALLEPGRENVWEFRICQPPRGLRLFGRFAERDIFIGTHCYKREDLPKGNKWPHQIKLCRHAWSSLFPAHPPLSSSSIHDFLGNARLPP